MSSRLAPLAALLLLFAMLVALLHSLARFHGAEQQVERTRDVIEQVYHARYGALRSGIWLRNYALSPASTEMLAHVRSSAAEAEEATRRLVELTKDDDPEQSRNAHALVREMGDLLDAYRSGADLAEQKGLAALQPVLSSRVHVDHTRRVRHRLQAMADRAQASLKPQRQTEKRYLRQITGIAVGLATLTLGLLIWAAWQRLQHLRCRQHGRDDAADRGFVDPLLGLPSRSP